MSEQQPWQPPEVRQMNFWDKLGWNLRKRRLGRQQQASADRARNIMEDRAREAGIPLKRGQIH